MNNPTGLIVRPGDTLIVLYDGNASTDDAAWYKAKLLERLPGLADVVLLSKTHGIAVYRADEAMGETA